MKVLSLDAIINALSHLTLSETVTVTDRTGVKWQAADEADTSAPVVIADHERPNREQADADQQLCRAVRDEILEIARGYKDQREENKSKDRIGFSTVAKLFDCALKWHRAAMEERVKKGDEDFAAWIVEEKRRLLNRGAH